MPFGRNCSAFGKIKSQRFLKPDPEGLRVNGKRTSFFAYCYNLPIPYAQKALFAEYPGGCNKGSKNAQKQDGTIGEFITLTDRNMFVKANRT